MAFNIFSLFGSIFVDSSEAEKSISKTEEKSNKLSESFMNGMSTIGTWAAGFATAAAGAAIAVGTAAISVSNDVDSAMNDFAASTGIAKDSLKEYEDAMLNIYNNNFGESFEDIANSMSQVKQVMGDLGAEELEAVTQNALMLRDTFEFDVTESVRAANSLMDQFGITSEEAYNLIAQGAQNGLNQNGDMMDVLNEYSLQFSQMGYSAEDMFNMISNGAESGTWSIDKLGDAAKEFNIRMSDGTANDAIKALGLNVEDVNKRYAAGGESAQGATQEILAALQAVENENERYMLGQQLMGTMWEDLGEDAVIALLDTEGAISNTKDALAEINEVKYDDIGSMIEGLKRNFETLLLPLGNALIPLITEVVGLIQTNMPVIESVIASLTPIISELFESLVPPLMDLISQILPPMVDLINAVLPAISSILSSLLPILISIVQTVLPVAVSFLNMLLPPVLQIVEMLLPILISLLNPILELLAQWIEIFNPIIEILMAVIEPLLQLLNFILPPLISIIAALEGVYIKALIWAFQLWADAVKFVADIITKAVTVAIEWIIEKFNIVVDYIKTKFVAEWKSNFENAKNILTNVFTTIMNFINDVFIQRWKTAFENAKNILTSIFTNIVSFVKNVFAGNWSAAFENLKTIVGNVFNAMITTVKTPVNTIITIINGLVSGVTNGINAVVGALNNMKIDVPAWVTELTGVSGFGFNIPTISAPRIPLLAKGGNAIEGGSAVVGEAGAELIDLPQGARVTPLTNNGDPIGYKDMTKKLDTMIDLLAAILAKEGVVNIGEKQFTNYINESLGALL